MSSTNSPGASCQIIMPLILNVAQTIIVYCLSPLKQATSMFVLYLVWVIQVLMKARCPNHRKCIGRTSNTKIRTCHTRVSWQSTGEVVKAVFKQTNSFEGLLDFGYKDVPFLKRW